MGRAPFPDLCNPFSMTGRSIVASASGKKWRNAAGLHDNDTAPPIRTDDSMAYLIFTANGEEFDRRELTRAIVIGRAPDCDASVHDIVLSRHHCKIEPGASESGQPVWIVTDLHSKNGTFLRGQKIETHTLKDGEELRIGRTRLTFMAGAFAPGREIRKRAVMRA